MIVNCKRQDKPYFQRTETLNLYMSDIRKYPLLTKEEEIQLIADAQQTENKIKSQKAIDKLVCCNQRFVISVAKKLGNDNNLLDLINEGNIGLIEAIKRFDIEKNCHFVTYAVWWIRKIMIKYLSTKENAVVPANFTKIYNYTNKIKEEFIQKYERAPFLHELQEMLRERYNFNVENLCDLEAFQSISIDEHYGDSNDDESIGESDLFNSVTASNNINVDVRKRDNCKIVEILLSKLNRRERFIIQNFYGIDCQSKTMDDLASELNLTKERIRQLISSSLKKLSAYHNFIED